MMATRELARLAAAAAVKQRGGVSRGYPPEFVNQFMHSFDFPMESDQFIEVLANACVTIERAA